MNKKNGILITMVALLSISVIILAIITYIGRAHSNSDIMEMGAIEADHTFMEENTALYQDTMALEDWSLTDYPYRVYIENPSDLISCGIDISAIDALEPFLDLYMGTYDLSGEKYQGKVLPDTFNQNQAIPQFTVSIQQDNKDELLIKCSYFVQQRLYEFSSSLSE